MTDYSSSPVHWGILGTANIARVAFLPGLAAAGGGAAYCVASRDLARAQEFASRHGIERAYGRYEDVLDDDRVEAVYIPLPNTLHAEWAIAALRAGKAVLCEKPLTLSVDDTEHVLSVARETGSYLWESFVFPFHRQTRRVLNLITDGELGEVRDVHSSFSFTLRNRNNIRLSRDLGGGALFDVGCYCIRLARLIFAEEATGGTALADWAPEGVDEQMHGVLAFPHRRRLLFSCGLRGPNNSFTRVLGTQGELRMTNPYHPGQDASLEIFRGDAFQREDASEGGPTFAPAIAHIQAVLRGKEAPRHLAINDALGNAIAIERLQASCELEL
jgi:predicted dehydrogenase